MTLEFDDVTVKAIYSSSRGSDDHEFESENQVESARRNRNSRKKEERSHVSFSIFLHLILFRMFCFLSYDDIFITFYYTKNQSTEVLNKIDNTVKTYKNSVMLIS